MPIKFSKTDSKYRCFSNFYMCPVTFYGITYTNSEAAWQSQKTLSIKERNKFSKEAPNVAKRHGRCLDLRPDWEKVKYQLMVEVCYAKFSQNIELGNILLSTGDEEIIENTTSWHDNIWGNCECTRCVNRVGQNLLGKALMEVRDKLRNKNNDNNTIGGTSIMRRVVFDIDDTAWGLNERVCEELGIDINNIESFLIANNDKLTLNERKLLARSYTNPEIFKNINWYDGFTDIFELEKLDCEVYINSNCNTNEVKKVKYSELVDKLGFNPDRILLNVISEPSSKELEDNVYIFVDDSPFNLAESTAKYNIALRKPWNTSEIGLSIIGDKDIIYCDSFNEIVTVIKELLKEK